MTVREKMPMIGKEPRPDFSLLYEQLGMFSYVEDGFSVQLKGEDRKILYKDIDVIVAYKVDLISYDEVCLEILCGNRVLRITEETPGWHQFVAKIKDIFPSIPPAWEIDIIFPPFIRNLTILFEKSKDRPD